MPMKKISLLSILVASASNLFNLAPTMVKAAEIVIPSKCLSTAKTFGRSIQGATSFDQS